MLKVKFTTEEKEKEIDEWYRVLGAEVIEVRKDSFIIQSGFEDILKNKLNKIEKDVCKTYNLY